VAGWRSTRSRPCSEKRNREMRPLRGSVANISRLSERKLMSRHDSKAKRWAQINHWYSSKLLALERFTPAE